MQVLHVFGSSQNEFYFDLSRMYADAVLRPDGVRHRFAAVAPDGAWRFGPNTRDLGKAMPLAQALDQVGTPDLIVPHMFCPKGMTTYRALFEDMLGIPVVGSPAAVTALATSKLWTRDVVASAGVQVARAQRLGPGDIPDLPAPFVVKPDSEDNSLGISVVHAAHDAQKAVAHARQYADTIFAEAFVPGRELRAAVIELDGDLMVPSVIEYPVSEARPIREVADKLEQDETGEMQQSARAEAQPICPADLSPQVRSQIETACRTAHRALRARHYSLYDFRLHAETGELYMLEAGLFWSFSDLSAITKMLRGSDMDATDVTGRIWAACAADTDKDLRSAA
ncbi:MAG: D-alanine--D-alanine ligase [Pseudomonadota bacterium]